MSRAPTLLTAFQMVKECGAFDYLDKTPPRSQVKEYLRLSERFDLPVLAGGWWYTLGRDEALLADNIQIGADLGSIVHNVQIMMDHADGRLVTDQEVADAYTSAYDLGAMLGCLPAFEVHVNMWSEDFRRVASVNHSHIIFKINNERELKVFGLDRSSPTSPLQLISTEFIPFTDYGSGAGYSLFDNSVACAVWIRSAIADAQSSRAA